MKKTKKLMLAALLTIMIGTTGYYAYSDYKKVGVYKDCVAANSLDVQRQDQIERYCYGVARGE
jgi:hypothetical protein